MIKYHVWFAKKDFTESLVANKPSSSTDGFNFQWNSPTHIRRNTNTQNSPSVEIPFSFGTGSDDGGDLGKPVEHQPTKQAQPKRPAFSKAIFVTRLDPHLTPKKVLNYIKSKGVDTSESEIDCRKLVKLGQNLDELSFCSFKISTNDELFKVLLDTSFWPSSVGIREFVANSVAGGQKTSRNTFSVTKCIGR